MAIRGIFCHPFSDFYSRHDKKVGISRDGIGTNQLRRIIRCFPQCSENGHVESGMCGSIIQLYVFGASWSDYERCGKGIYAYGEFCEVGQDDQLRTGAIVSGSFCEMRERSHGDPTLPFIHCIASPARNIPESIRKYLSSTAPQLIENQDNDLDILELKLNTDLVPWHYSWVSTKHTCNWGHVFTVRIFSTTPGSDNLEYIGSVSSPVFRVRTRRQQRALRHKLSFKTNLILGISSRDTIQNDAIQESNKNNEDATSGKRKNISTCE